MEVNPKDASLPAHRLWLRGGEHLWRMLAAEEDFFRKSRGPGGYENPCPRWRSWTCRMCGAWVSSKHIREPSPTIKRFLFSFSNNLTIPRWAG